MKKSFMFVLFITVFITMFVSISCSGVKDYTTILVEGGTFSMGDGNGSTDITPIHSVTLSSFYIGKYKITQKEYKKVMGLNPSDENSGIGDNFPVNKVSWYEALEFCNTVSIKKGLDPCYSGSGTKWRCDFSKNGYRLPTEAEWEYAAKGGLLANDFIYSGSNSIEEVAWFTKNSDVGSGRQGHPVGMKVANKLGIYDMSGNVFDWCWDWYGSYRPGDLTNPVGASSGAGRVKRGGYWNSSSKYCRVVNRGYGKPASRFYSIGFRLVRRP